MNRLEAEDYFYKSYHRAEAFQDWAAPDSEKRRPDLTRDLLRELSGTPSIVVTGSKGKGSVSMMIAQLLGGTFRVGLMTSPHIRTFNERFRVDGKEISDCDLVRMVGRVKPVFDQIDSGLPQDVCISPMGIQAAVALVWFAEMRTEFNVFECGKGARYDDVNGIPHEYAVINKIFLEHTRELGKTIGVIAANKSYVMTGEERCAFSAEQCPEAEAVLAERSSETQVPLACYGRDFRAENIAFTKSGMTFDFVSADRKIPDLTVPLLGRHQAENAALAIAAVLRICRDHGRMLSDDEIRSRLNALHWPGRMQILSGEPFMMLDACINRASVGSVADTLRALGLDCVTAIVGIPDDKDFAGVAAGIAPMAADILLTRSRNPHYIFTPRQTDVLAAQGIPARWTSSVPEAVTLARALGRPTVILGTTSVVAEVEDFMTSAWQG